MTSIYSGWLGLFCVVSLSVSGCGPRNIVGPREVAGEYTFRYKSGEVEVLILRDDTTYRQELYRDVTTYRQQGAPLYTNSGSWSYRKNRVVMPQWLMFCNWPSVDEIRPTPRRSLSLEGSWWPPTHEREAVILLAENSPRDYALVRVKNRNEVK